MNQENLKIFLDFHNKENWPELFNLKTDTEHTYNRSRETRRCPSCKKRMDNIEFRYQLRASGLITVPTERVYGSTVEKLNLLKILIKL